jgi:hypothetical protein
MMGTPPDRPLSILLFCDDNPNHASMILDHIEALVRWSRHEIHLFDCIYHPGDESLDLNAFDVVAVHYAVWPHNDEYLSPLLRRKIREFRGLKVQFIQDDYRDVDLRTRAMRYMGIDVVFTLVPEAEHHRIWHDRLRGVELVTWLAGYIPDRLVGRELPPLAARPIEVGYRGREMPFWLGALARDKVDIAEGFLRHAARFGVRCDISCREEDRLYGKAWDRFNAQCRAMLGCGSGATIADFDGSSERAVRGYLAMHPTATYEEVATRVLGPWEGNLDLNVISPRLFEAIAARTALVLFPGDYSGILHPGEHYIPLARDFSNIKTVVAQIRDLPTLEAMTARAYDEVIASGRYSYAAFIRDFDALVERRRKPEHRPTGSKADVARAQRRLGYRLLRSYRRVVNAVRFGQRVRLGLRTKRRRFVCTVPFYRLQYVVVRALQVTWAAYRAVRDWSARSLRRHAHRPDLQPPPCVADDTSSDETRRCHSDPVIPGGAR